MPALPAAVGRARVARLATADGAGRPHIVPVVFCVVEGAVYVPIDGKPKPGLRHGRRLKRIANIERNPAVALLVDDYAEDWAKLAWTRIDGEASVVATSEAVAAALRARYPQYARVAVGETSIRIEVRRVSDWHATARRHAAPQATNCGAG